MYIRIMENNLEKRMYGLCLYSISPIQAGIQFLHSTVEYANSYFNDTKYQDWANNWKTVILLNGGTTITLNKYVGMLNVENIKCAAFYEPDLNNAITSISFLLDSESFGRENEPFFLRNHFLKYDVADFRLMIDEMKDLEESNKLELETLIKNIGIKKLFLKFFTSKFNLASN